MKNIAAIILTGGKNNRLKIPYPKCLLPLGSGVVIIGRILSILHKVNIKNIYIVTRNNDQSIQNYLGKTCKYIKQHKPLGNAHALLTALRNKSSIRHRSLLVLMSDSTALYYPETIKRFINMCIENKTQIGITLFPQKHKLKTSGNVYLDKNNNFLSVRLYHEDTKNYRGTPFIQGGYWFFNTQWVKKYISKINRSSINNEYNLTDLLTYAKLQGYIIMPYIIRDKKQWSSVNTFKEYLELILKIKNQK